MEKERGGEEGGGGEGRETERMREREMLKIHSIMSITFPHTTLSLFPSNKVVLPGHPVKQITNTEI